MDTHFETRGPIIDVPQLISGRTFMETVSGRPMELAVAEKPATPADKYYQNLMMAWKEVKAEVAAVTAKQKDLPVGATLSGHDIQTLGMKLAALSATLPPAIGMRHIPEAMKAARYLYNCQKKFLGQKDKDLLGTMLMGSSLLREKESELCRVMLNFVGRNTKVSDGLDKLHKAARDNHDKLVSGMVMKNKVTPKGPWRRPRQPSNVHALAA